jgi:putative Mn2+ efflux pump MntP
MNLSATIILAFGMSMDAFAAAIGKGATLHRPRFLEAFRTGIIFGAVEAITPLIGWGAGLIASQYIMEWDHWVAFLLLMVLGLHMIWQGLHHQPTVQSDAPTRHSFWVLAATAVGTSLDALAVGVGLAFLQVNIIYTALAIGTATMLMATLGMMIGRFIGPLIGRWAEILGGVVLISIGSHILLEHLGYF